MNQQVPNHQAELGPLSSNLDEPTAVPYFLWDEPMTVEELKRRIREGSYPEQVRLVGKILREARDTDVWLFTTPDFVVEHWDAVSLHAGRRKAFWQFLFNAWAGQGRLGVAWSG